MRDKELGCAFCSSAILYIEAFLGGVGGTRQGGEILVGWKGELCRALQRAGVLGEARPPREMGEKETEHLWSSAAATMRSVESSTEHPEHPSCSRPSSGVVGDLCHKIFQNHVEGPSVHVRSWVIACVCTEGGDGVCNVHCVLLNAGETPAGGRWGDSDRDGRG